MSLKSTYQTLTSLLLAGIMLWNVIGWVAVGLVHINEQAHAEEAHCEVSFCFCKIEDGEKICSCHHPELHRKASEQTPFDAAKHITDTPKEAHNYCYYSKPHDIPSQPDALIVWAEYTTLFPAITSSFFFVAVDVYPSKTNTSILEGFQPDLLRPPIA